MAMSFASGNVTIAADLNKSVESHVSFIAAGAGASVTSTPTIPMQSVVIDNESSNWIRATITFAAGIISGVAAVDRNILVPPGVARVHGVDFGDVPGNNAVGAINPISAVVITPVLAPTVSGKVTATVPAVATAALAGVVVLNFASA